MKVSLNFANIKDWDLSLKFRTIAVNVIDVAKAIVRRIEARRLERY